MRWQTSAGAPTKRRHLVASTLTCGALRSGGAGAQLLTCQSRPGSQLRSELPQRTASPRR